MHRGKVHVGETLNHVDTKSDGYGFDVFNKNVFGLSL